MVCAVVDDVVIKHAQQGPDLLGQAGVGPCAVQVGIGLKHVQVGVHGLFLVGVLGAKA